MKRIPFSFVVTLLVVAVSAPAQSRGDARGERNVRSGIVSSRQHVDARLTGVRPGGSRHIVATPDVRHGSAVVHRDPFGRGNVGYGPVLHAPSCNQPRGYWTTVCEPVLVEPGHWHTEYVPAVYGWVYDSCGHLVWGIVEPACHKQVWCPPRYEDRHRRVWVAY